MIKAILKTVTTHTLTNGRRLESRYQFIYERKKKKKKKKKRSRREPGF